MMQSSKHWNRCDAADLLGPAKIRSISIQCEMGVGLCCNMQRMTSGRSRSPTLRARAVEPALKSRQTGLRLQCERTSYQQRGNLAAAGLPAALTGNIFNADNEMTTFNAAAALTYDANGNLTRHVDRRGMTTAALALWFILFPPGSLSLIRPGNASRPDLNAPLKNWIRYNEYAPTWYRSKSACDKYTAKRRNRDPVLKYAQCVSKDDPRLEGGIGQP
jgi:YD repeat-containing protein